MPPSEAQMLIVLKASKTAEVARRKGGKPLADVIDTRLRDTQPAGPQARALVSLLEWIGCKSDDILSAMLDEYDPIDSLLTLSCKNRVPVGAGESYGGDKVASYLYDGWVLNLYDSGSVRVFSLSQREAQVSQSQP